MMFEEDWGFDYEPSRKTQNQYSYEKKTGYQDANEKNRKIRLNSKEIQKLEQELAKLKKNL